MSQFYLLFDRVEIDQANALSSPLTYGFPAISGFVGAMHHLARRLPTEFPLALEDGVLIACHRCVPQIFRANVYSDATFNQSRHPLKKDGKTAAIVEEGKVTLTVSLVVNVAGDRHIVLEQREALCDLLREKLMQQRVAGGSVRNVKDVRLYYSQEDRELAFALAPAYVLTDARAEMPVILAELRSGIRHHHCRGKVKPVEPETPTGLPPQPRATALEVLLSTAEFFLLPPGEGETDWKSYNSKTGRGWLVPIAVGYQAISPVYPAGKMRHLRNPDYSSRYVETLCSLGKWEFAPRLAREQTLDDHFWRYQPPQDNLYLFSTRNHS